MTKAIHILCQMATFLCLSLRHLVPPWITKGSHHRAALRVYLVEVDGEGGLLERAGLRARDAREDGVR
jgi:hypothetical protein